METSASFEARSAPLPHPAMWKRSMVQLVSHRQTKEPGTDRLHLTRRATSRLYPTIRRKGYLPLVRRGTSVMLNGGFFPGDNLRTGVVRR